jgi:hypothetical protein
MRKNLIFWIVLVCFLTLSAVSVLAQGSRPLSSVERRVETMNRQGREYEREDQRREMEGKNNNPVDIKRTQQIRAELKEDFERIQAIYNSIVIAMSGKNAVLDYKFVADQATEIKKRGLRLKTNLALPQPEDENEEEKKEEELTEEQMKPSLMSLCNHIYNFLTNPMFESKGAIDVELSTKASRELNEIIKLSESVRKCADKINKPNQ